MNDNVADLGSGESGLGWFGSAGLGLGQINGTGVVHSLNERCWCTD